MEKNVDTFERGGDDDGIIAANNSAITHSMH